MQRKELRHQSRANLFHRMRKSTVILLAIVAAIVVSIGIGSALFLYPILNKPESLFNQDPKQTTPPVARETQVLPADTIQPPEMTPDENSDEAIVDESGIVNILLMGVENKASDHIGINASPGDDAHTDAMIVVAVNFDQGTVDLISVPRDTFTVVDEIRGCYKLNAVINYGGGKSADNGQGFLTTCSAVSHFLGGVRVDYYYAVDFQAAINAVDAIGGIDYDMDMDYTGDSGSYTKGPTHLSGEGVLDYLRARTQAEGATDDASRVDRQKRMLKAILRQLQSSNLLVSIPRLLSTISGGQYTNLTFQQITALANFAMSVDTASMGTYSLYGEVLGAMPGASAPDGWTFSFMDENNRQTVLETVYGISASPLTHCSYAYSDWLRWYGFTAWNAMNNARTVLNWAQEQNVDAGDLVDAEDLRDYLSDLEYTTEVASLSISEADTVEMMSDVTDVEAETQWLAEQLGYPEALQWYVQSDWWADPTINTVVVDFN